jgi:hypothetical protein
MRRPGVDLARAPDLEVRVAVQLHPLRDPAGQAPEREDRGEHVGRRADRVVDHARVEVDVRVELALDEVVVLQRDLLELHRDLEQLGLHAELLEHLGARLLDDLHARVEVAVDAVAEAHQPRGVVAALRALDELPRRDPLVADLGEHLDHLLVGAAVAAPPERVDARRHRREQVHHRRADQAHGARRAVLLVVGVQDQQQIERLLDHRIDVVGLARRREHHVQEVRRVGELVLGIDDRLADRVLVRAGGHRAHLRDQPVHRDLDLALRARIERVGVERGERADRGRAGRHRMRVLGQRAEEALEVLVEHRVDRDRAHEVVELLAGRQLPVDQEIGDLEEGALRGELLDRDAAVAQDPLLAVDERDRAATRAGVRIAGIERDVAGLRAQRADVDAALALAPVTIGSSSVLPSTRSCAVSAMEGPPSRGMSDVAAGIGQSSRGSAREHVPRRADRG